MTTVTAQGETAYEGNHLNGQRLFVVSISPSWPLTHRKRVLRSSLRMRSAKAAGVVGKQAPSDGEIVPASQFGSFMLKPTNGAPERPLILIVDDDLEFRDGLTHALSERGYRTIPAGDGREALCLLASERPVLILIDLMMPTMGGREFVQRVRQIPHHKDVQLVIITAANDSMLGVTLDLPVVYKGNIDTILEIVRRRLG